MIQKANEGVAVRVVYDDFGSRKIRRKMVKEMKAAGIEIYPFYKIILVAFANRLNYRDHRKIIIIDGKVGFFGGINISDRYDNSIQNDLYWRDTHLKLTGPFVNSLQYHFITSWNFCSPDKLIASHELFPHPEIKQNASNKELAQVVVGGPDYPRLSIMLSFLKIFTLARERLYITTSYFIPNESILNSLKQAAISGVDVRLLLPGISDSFLVDWASKFYLPALLKAGVRVFFYQKGFLHAKTLVADGKVGVVGTANMDIWSFDLNFEINAIVYGETFNKKLENVFLEDLKHTTEAKLEDWESISKAKQLKYSIARLLSSLL